MEHREDAQLLDSLADHDEKEHIIPLYRVFRKLLYLIPETMWLTSYITSKEVTRKPEIVATANYDRLTV